jgi:K+-transporting ATPase ATPase A chain
VTEQTIALGPAASQIAIKQLGTNGGGFFNVNSAHPFENPTPLSNFLRAVSHPADPRGALLHRSADGATSARAGRARGDARDLRAALLGCYLAPSRRATPVARPPRRRQAALPLQPGGNMEGKEVRFGIANSALWATATTAASNGSVNAMHDSFTPLGGLVPMWLMQLGEVVFGGVGSGSTACCLRHRRGVHRRADGRPHARVPRQEDRGLRDEDGHARACWCRRVVLASARDRRVARGPRRSSSNPAPHGFSEILYAFSLGGEQQRQRVRRPHRQHAVLQHDARPRDADRPLLMIVPVLAIAGVAGEEEAVARVRRHVADAHAALRRLLSSAPCCWSAR